MKRLLIILSMFIACTAMARPLDREGPVVIDLRTDLRSSLDTSLTAGYVFACPPENDLCTFIASELADTNCDVGSSPNVGWNLINGTDATLCDNQRFNGDVPDEAARVDRPNGFWTHSGAGGDIAEITAEITIVGAGAGSDGAGNIIGMLQGSFSTLCMLAMDDIAVTDPAELLLRSITGTQDIGHAVTAGDSFRVVIQYDAGAGDDCEMWIDPINVQPRSGTLANGTRATTATVDANIAQVRNSLGTNLLTVKNVAACPDGCTY